MPYGMYLLKHEFKIYAQYYLGKQLQFARYRSPMINFEANHLGFLSITLNPKL